MSEPIADALASTLRREAPHVLAALLRRGAGLEDCEDACQEALLAATQQWPAGGIPTSPRGWLIRAASRRLIDQQRSRASRTNREILDAYRAELDRPSSWADRGSDSDDSLQLLILCAHPCLTPTSAVALTLRAVAGLTTRQVATALLASEATVAQRISRAKKTLRTNAVSFGPIAPTELPQRVHAVRHVLHLMFTTGSTREDGPDLVDTSLTGEAIRLTERLHRALPHDPETAGLLALMLLVDARTPARLDGQILVPLADQDRSSWKRAAITRATRLLEQALPHGPVGTFQLQAAIAAVHCDAPTYADTDWPQILTLYRMLADVAPSPAVDLGRAIALSEVEGARAGLDALTPLLRTQSDDPHVIATLAHLLDVAGEPTAPDAYRRAAALTASDPTRRYLEQRADSCLLNSRCS